MARTGVRAAAIIIRDNKILLMHRRKHGLEYWVFPGGGVEDTETSDEAVVREVKEETDLDVTRYKVLFMDEKDGIKHPYYLCEVSSNEPQIIGEENDRNTADNFYELQWIPLQDVQSINLLPETTRPKILNFISTLK